MTGAATVAAEEEVESATAVVAEATVVDEVTAVVGGGDGGGGGGGAGATACRLRSTDGGTSSLRGGTGRGLIGRRQAARGLAFRRQTTGEPAGSLSSGCSVGASAEECCCCCCRYRPGGSSTPSPSIRGRGFLVGFLPFWPPPPRLSK